MNDNKVYLRFENFNIEVDREYTANEYLNLDRRLIGNFCKNNKNVFRFSQVVDSMLYYYSNQIDNNIKFESTKSKVNRGYIIPVAVKYHPDDWTDKKEIKSIFEFISSTYLEDLKSGKAILLIDQSVEGYNTKWLWDWFHKKCKKYDIPYESIIYLTGDQSCIDTYDDWCNRQNITNKIKVIPSISLSMYIKKHYLSNNFNIKFDEILNYKKENNIFLFDCTNMRPRLQRILNYLHLIESGLINKGNISMPSPREWKHMINLSDNNFLQSFGLSKNVINKLDYNSEDKKTMYSKDSIQYYEYIERILIDVYKNSWVSVVTESSYFEYENNVFVSEKTFKPIACMQPFIIVGSKGVLKYLRKLGYKTFHPYIDESYDNLDDCDRFIAIVNCLKKIDSIEDKKEWYKNIKNILEHNFNLFMQIGKIKSIEHEEIEKYYFEYFRSKNV